ncbi:hypothetical protein SLS56_008257 [Neofusicoccum ribis]|uniref:Transcription factor domain-containing protein n=1 Tax=Neofusicoccum ribis TaxID=45134 RepID=A0ABR3SKP1_9PEZI
MLFDGFAYDLKWDGYRTAPGLDTPALPTLDYAIFLINAVKFHCSQTFHLFDEESFMRCLYDFYSDPTPRIAAADLWYIHFLAILAFGKAFTTRKANGNTPPGADFFLKAIQLLPEMNALVRQPLLSAEILCCIALYFQCLDYRHAAHNYIGIAMRLAMFEGMHTDMPIQHLGEAQVERYLPNFSGSVQRAAALNMQIKLSRVIAKINRGVYGANGRLNSKFLLSTKEVLAGIAGLADELRNSFPLHLDNTISGISRTSAHLHLLYHQCIVLATRPLLFCFLKIRFESQGTNLDPLNSSQTAWNLIKMCIDSSQQMINILNCLQAQDLLGKPMHWLLPARVGGLS